MSDSHSVRAIVFRLLDLYPAYREVTTGEEELIKHVQRIEKSYNIKVRKSSTISRVARIDREKHPEHRGKDWEENQRHAKQKVRLQIKADTFGRKNPEPYENIASYLL